LRAAAALVLVALAAHAPGAQAQGSEVERVRAATAKLINLLVEQGVLTQVRAEALLKEFEAPAAAAPAAPAPTAKSVADAAPATVRVPYVPEFVRKEMKEELRTEMAAQALREGWAGPGAVPGWVRAIKFDGDLRTRYEFDNFDSANAAAVNVAETNRTRALTLLNTTEDRHRLRVRARFGLVATADQNWAAGVRLTTGNTTDPLSSNQTLGNYNNRYTAAFDRAYIRYHAGDELSAVIGRFGNPWFGTDLVWANDLSFDGAAVQWTPRLGPGRGFLTLAAVPVQEVELSAHDKWLFGAQLGAELPGNGVVRGRLGLAYYRYVNIVGKANEAGLSLNDTTAPAFVQKGNTFFNISSDSARPLLALASDYRIVDLTGTLAIESLASKHLVLTADVARNVGYDRAAVALRAGRDVEPQTRAYLLRVAFGDLDVHQADEWQVFFSYKRVERDAVLDAFTDSDLRLGGTDAKGYVLGGSLGLGKNTAATLRWLSADSVSGAPLSVDVLHLDLSVRF
jgi:hypothetical protein